MGKEFSNEVNLLKALAIMLVVSGHLEFSLLGIFPPYSFQLALFFFISGYLFKDKYLNDVQTYLKNRVKSLLVPYFLYSAFYAVVTIIIYKLTNVFWGEPITLKNFFITPFLNGHQLDLSCPLWFVTQLFITLIVFLFLMRALTKTTANKFVHLGFFSVLGLIAIPLSKIIELNPVNLLFIKTIFSLFFVYLGYFYKSYIKDNYNIFTPKIAGFVIVLQSILWLFNRDYDPEHGIGLSYVLVWARFDDQMIVPVITSITGIWASLLVTKLLYPYLKEVKFLQYMGQVTYHIMANHLLVMFILTAIAMKLCGVPFSERAAHDIYWIYNPVQNTYLFFVLTMIITTYTGVALRECNKFLQEKVTSLTTSHHKNSDAQ